MIDRSDLRCPNCGSYSLKQGFQVSAGGGDTTRKERELCGLRKDDIQTLECKPKDPTWYGCIMCNTEFDGEGNIYKIRKMYPFSKDSCGMID